MTTDINATMSALLKLDDKRYTSPAGKIPAIIHITITVLNFLIFCPALIISHAVIAMVPILTSSAGWNCPPGILIHLVAPFLVIPRGVFKRNMQARPTKYITSPNFLK